LDALIFVASTAAFDQKLSEDPEINRFIDSVVCFEEIIRNKFLAKVG
jgi:hypothetical protein